MLFVPFHSFRLISHEVVFQLMRKIFLLFIDIYLSIKRRLHTKTARRDRRRRSVRTERSVLMASSCISRLTLQRLPTYLSYQIGRASCRERV